MKNGLVRVCLLAVVLLFPSCAQHNSSAAQCKTGTFTYCTCGEEGQSGYTHCLLPDLIWGPCECPPLDGDADLDSEPEAERDDDPDETIETPPTRSSCADAPENWIERFGNVDSDLGINLVRTATGSLYLAGYSDGNIDFGNGLLDWPPRSKDTFEPGFLAFFNAGGQNLWGLAPSVLLQDYILDNWIPVFAQGSAANMVWGVSILDSQSHNPRILMLSFSADGKHQQTKLDSDLLGEHPELLAIAADSQGSFYIATDNEISKFGPDGILIWRHPVKIGTDDKVFVAFVAFGYTNFTLLPLEDGGLALAGSFIGTLEAGGYSFSGPEDVSTLFVLRFGAEGYLRWAFSLDQEHGAYGPNFSEDGNGSFLLSTDSVWPLLPDQPDSKGTVVAKISEAGQLVWLKPTVANPSGSRATRCLVRDKANRLFQSSEDYIMELGNDGSVLGRFTLPPGVVVKSLVPDETGGVYATGWLDEGEVSLFCGTLKTAGSADAFLMHLAKIPSVTGKR